MKAEYILCIFSIQGYAFKLKLNLTHANRRCDPFYLTLENYLCNKVLESMRGHDVRWHVF